MIQSRTGLSKFAVRKKVGINVGSEPLGNYGYISCGGIDLTGSLPAGGTCDPKCEAGKELSGGTTVKCSRGRLSGDEGIPPICVEEGKQAVKALVERFDIEPYSEFSAK